VAGLPGVPLAIAGAGLWLLLSGVRNVPLAAIGQAAIKGQAPPSGPGITTESGSGSGGSGGGGGAAPGDTGAATATAAHNQALGRILAAPYGWSTGTEWADLVSLWNQESGWSNTAENASGAFGIPQALPADKMPLAARPTSEGGSANPRSQIEWGLSYIKGRYGDPKAAWAHEVANDWY
jgi:hypothetical protein